MYACLPNDVATETCLSSFNLLLSTRSSCFSSFSMSPRRHYPKQTFTIVADTPENLRLRQQSELQSQVHTLSSVTARIACDRRGYRSSRSTERRKASLRLACVYLGVVLSGQHGWKQGSCPLGGGFTCSPWVTTWQPRTCCQVPAVLALGHVLNIQAKYYMY